MATTQTSIENESEFLRDYYAEEIAELARGFPSGGKSLYIDWFDCFRFDPDFGDDAREQPGRIVDRLERALEEYSLPVDVDLSQANVRLQNLPEEQTHSVGGYRHTEIGKLVAITGQVAMDTDVLPTPTVAAFECQRCGTLNEIPQHDDVGLQEPHECNGCERQGPYRLNQSQTQFEVRQGLRLQQPAEEVATGQGAHLDVELQGDVVKSATAGDRVTVNGVLGIEDTDDALKWKLEGHSVEPEETTYEELDIDEYLDEIQTLAAGEHGDPYQLLVDSIAPKIKGMEEIKQALALQLFGGNRIEKPDGTIERGESHILLLGDPGTGKSKQLKAINNIAPRSCFTSGKGATAAGLTAAAVRNDFGQQQWTLEAGALVLANDGVACVDEIDKVNEEAKESLHEALESGSVSVSKAGINTSLPARTALLAAGNPKHGRFDDHEAIADQIDLDPALISRFDLMFMIDDKPDSQRDQDISDAIIEDRQVGAKYTADPESLSDDEREKIQPAVDREVLRAWVAYAKQNITPVLSDQLREELRDWFVDIRTMNEDQEDAPIPTTYRKLEGVLRLAESSARVRLSDEIEHEDIERAKDLVLRSMEDVGMDPDTGQFDADIIETGTSKSQRDKINKLKTLVNGLADENANGAPHEELVEIMVEEQGENKPQVEHDIKKLKDKGEIYQPEKGYYRTT